MSVSRNVCVAVVGFFVLVGCVVVPAAQAATTYAVTPITDQAGIDEASINSNGQAALTVWWGSCCDDAEYWSNGTIQHVPYPSGCFSCGGEGASAVAINGAGQITGAMSDTDSSNRDFWHAYRYSISTGTTTFIPTLGGESAFGNGINGAGQVVGESDTASGASHAFLWNGTTITDLGTLGGQDSRALASYASGQAVGCAQTTTGAYHPFLYQGGTLKDLGLPTGMTQGCAISVNSAGTILGWAQGSKGACAGWLWKAGTRTVLPKVNGQCFVVGSISDTGFFGRDFGHIANTGQVVGGVTNTAGTPMPVVYQNGSASFISGSQTPFDPQSAAGDPTAGWYGLASGNNLHGVISLLGPTNSSNTLYLLTPIDIMDETNASITYSSGWIRTALSGAYGGYVKQSATVGTTASLTFTGKSVSVIGATASHLGSATVSIDGISKGTLSEAGAAATRVRLTTIYFPTRGQHTLRLTLKSGIFKLDAITVAPY